MDHAQLPVVFKNLIRRDPKTRERATNELYSLIKKIYNTHEGEDRKISTEGVDQKELYSVLLCWSQVYPKLAIDISNPIRGISHKIQGFLFSKALTVFSPSSQSLSSGDSAKAKSKYNAVLKLVGRTAGSWYTGIYDTDRAVSVECRAGFEGVFPAAPTAPISRDPKLDTYQSKPSKQDVFFTTFEHNILAYISDILNNQSPESLSDTRYVPKDETILKYERAQRLCLLACAGLIDHKKKKNSAKSSTNEPVFDESSAAYTTFLDIVSVKSFWKLTSSTNPLLSRAALKYIPKIASSVPAYVLEEQQKDIFNAFIKTPLAKGEKKDKITGLDDTDAIQALTLLTRSFPQIWSYKSGSSSGDDSKKDKKDSKKKKSKDSEKSPKDDKKKEKKDKPALVYLANFLKIGNSQHNALYWHVVMGLLIEIPAPFSPFPDAKSSLDHVNYDSEAYLEPAKIITASVAHAAYHAPIRKLVNRTVVPGSMQKSQSSNQLSAASDTWSFYLVLVEKIFSEAKKRQSDTGVQFCSDALKNISSYLYDAESPATGIILNTSLEAENSTALARSAAANQKAVQDLNDTLLVISQRVAEKLWPYYPAECLTELDNGLHAVYEKLTNATNSAPEDEENLESKNANNIQGALTNAVTFTFNIYQQLIKLSQTEPATAVVELLKIFIDRVVELYGKLFSIENFTSESLERVSATGVTIELVLTLFKADKVSTILSDESLVLKFKQLCTVYFNTISSVPNSQITSSIYKTNTSIVYKFLQIAKSSTDSNIPIDTNALVYISVEKVLEQRPPVEALTIDDQEQQENRFFNVLSKFLSFYDILSSGPLSDSTRLSEHITGSLVNWLQHISPTSNSTDLNEISDEAAQSVLYALLSHSAVLTDDDALKLLNAVVDKAVSLEKQYLEGVFVVSKLNNENKESADSKVIKMKNKLKWIISQIRSKDAQFILSYTSSDDGKSALKDLWKIANDEHQQPAIEGSSQESSFIDSLITQLDFFSISGSKTTNTTKPNTSLDPEVILKIVKDLKGDILSTSLLELEMPIQQSLSILSSLGEKKLGTSDKKLKTEVLEQILFEKQQWEDVLAPIFSYGIPQKAILSGGLTDSRGAACFILEPKAISKSSLSGSTMTTHLSKEFVQSSLQLINMCMFTLTVTLQFPSVFEKSDPNFVLGTIYGIYYSSVVFEVLSDHGVLQSLSNSQHFGYPSTKKKENSELVNATNDEESKKQLAETYLEVIKGIRRDTHAFITGHDKLLQSESSKTFDIILASTKPTKEPRSSIAQQVNLGSGKPFHKFFADLWDSCLELSNSRSYYSYIILERLLTSFFSTDSDKASTLIPAASDLKTLLPNRVINKLGTLALVTSLTHVSPQTNVIAEGLSSLRNNLLADVTSGSRAGLHTDKQAIYALALLVPALYHSGHIEHDIILPTLESSKLVGISPFKISSFIARVANSFDEFYDAEYGPFAILLGRVISALSKAFIPQDFPASSFWEPVLEYVNAIITASSALTGSEDNEEEEGDKDSAGSANRWYANAFLKSGLEALNTYMTLYNIDSVDDDFDNGNMKTEEVDENLRNIHTTLVDTLSVFCENNTMDLSLSKQIFKYFSDSIRSNAPGSFPYYETEITPFYNFLSRNDPYLQQTALVVISDELQMNQKQRALEYATISQPTEEDITQQLIPIELLSLILSPPIEPNTSKFRSHDIIDTMTTSKARQYFYTWYIIFQYFEQSVYSLRKVFISQLTENNSITILLNSISVYVPGLQKGPEKSWDITKFDTKSTLYVDSVYPQNDENLDADSEDVLAMKKLLWNLLFHTLNYAGVIAKNWFNGTISVALRADSESIISKYISPLLIQSELESVKKYAAQSEKEEAENANDDDDDIGVIGVKRTELTISRNSRLISLRLYVDSQFLEIALNIPDGYPLQDIRIEGVKRVGASERQWRSWILLSQAILLQRYSGSIVSAIELFKRNATMYFEGFTECAICYSVLQDDKSLPNKECSTCHNKFHAFCLQQWFKSGGSEACPLCRTEKAFK